MSLIALLLPALLVGGLGWTIYALIRQDHINRALIAAIKKNDTKTALTLLDEGADANSRDEPPQHLSLWRLMLDRLHNKQPASSTAPTALMLACAWREENARVKPWPAPDNWRLVRALLERGAQINIIDKKTAETPLLLAASLNKTHVCQLLIERKADVNATDSLDMTPLMEAAINQNKALVRLLVDKGADVNAVHPSGMLVTPLIAAQVKGDDDPTITELLLSRGARPNAGASSGWTALLMAIIDNRVRSVRTLLQHGADVNLKTDIGSPIGLAKERRYPKIVQILKQAGAKE